MLHGSCLKLSAKHSAATPARSCHLLALSLLLWMLGTARRSPPGRGGPQHPLLSADTRTSQCGRYISRNASSGPLGQAVAMGNCIVALPSTTQPTKHTCAALAYRQRSAPSSRCLSKACQWLRLHATSWRLVVSGMPYSPERRPASVS